MGEVVLRDVRKRYGDFEAVRGVGFNVGEGECVVILGPSGAGKTSILKMVAGLEEVTAGEIYIDGRLVNNLEPHERDVAMTFETYALYPQFSVYDNLAFPLRAPRHKVPEVEIAERVARVSGMLGIGGLLDRLPAQLSQGQKQRVGLGRTLGREPSVFLFDEPLAHVDAKIRNRMRMEIKGIQQQLGCTSVFVTHDYVEALALGSRIAVLNKGELQQIGTPRDVFESPANEFVARIVGDPPFNFMLCTLVSDGGARTFVTEDGLCKIPVPMEVERKIGDRTGQHLKLGIRPMYVTPTFSAQEGPLVRGSVYVFERRETRGILTVRVGETRLTAMTDPDLKVQIDQAICLRLDPDRIRVFDPESTQVIAP
jgi:multiple sugar transport system ATP-binding protein